MKLGIFNLNLLLEARNNLKNMITVRTRSSRLFVVLLHLVGVSTHLPSTPGIVGVNPFSIVLETLDPSQLEIDETDYGVIQRQPHWLQDALGDQACLDPMGGFSECGDATLWLVIPKRSSRRQAKWRQWITWATEEEETDENTSTSRIQGYALQLYYESHESRIPQTVHSDSNPTPLYPYQTSHSPSTSHLSEKECLTRRRKDNQLVLVPCSQDRAWSWHFNEYGILHFKKPKSKSTQGDVAIDRLKPLLQKQGKKSLECLGRNSTHAAVLVPCDGHQAPSRIENREKLRVLQIGLVRQATARSMTPASQVDHTTPPNKETNKDETMQTDSFPPSRIDMAHSHASASNNGAMHREKLRGATRLGALSSSNKSPSPEARESTLSLAYFKTVNPIILANGHVGLGPAENPTMSKTPADSPVGSVSSSRPLIRKIQTNPYVTDSVDEIWTDPLTGLEYHTDLCHYLGHDRAEAGRHTLTGVGQYMKTVFNIKVG